jgi:hypothetical protein
MKVIQFPQPNGTVLVLTQDAQDPTRFTSRYEDGRTVSQFIRDSFAAGQIKKS